MKSYNKGEMENVKGNIKPKAIKFPGRVTLEINMCTLQKEEKEEAPTDIISNFTFVRVTSHRWKL